MRRNLSNLNAQHVARLSRGGKRTEMSFSEFVNQKKEEYRHMQIIRDLKQFDADTTQLEDMVVLSAVAKLTRAEFETRNIPVPEWLDDVNRKLTTAIDTQTRESKLLKLRELTQEEERLMPAGERRARVAAQREALEKELAGVK